jgi:O-acetylhomoserine (thiol)-lyase
MRDFGCTQSPQSAFILGLGLESLHVRVQRHCENALKVAKFLQSHPNVTWVKYPDLEGDEFHELAKKYLPNGSCGVVSFGIKGGRPNAEKFMKNMTLGAIETHVADARTCCLHPASSTHRQMSDEELVAAGVAPNMVRLSCGLESTEDLLADVEQALGQA